MVSRTATGGRSRSVEKMIHRARSAELSIALWRKCLPRWCDHLCWCYPFEGHDIPFRYCAHCAGARRHDWPRRAADAPPAPTTSSNRAKLYCAAICRLLAHRVRSRDGIHLVAIGSEADMPRPRAVYPASRFFDPKRTFCAIGGGLFRAPATSTLTVANISGAAPCNTRFWLSSRAPLLLRHPLRMRPSRLSFWSTARSPMGPDGSRWRIFSRVTVTRY